MEVILSKENCATPSQPKRCKIIALLCCFSIIGVAVAAFVASNHYSLFNHDNSETFCTNYNYNNGNTSKETKEWNSTNSFLSGKLKQIRKFSPSNVEARVNCAESINQNEIEVCYTEECLDSALRLLKSINFSVDPCNNFYDFACGRWSAENPAPPTSLSWGSYDIVRKHIDDVMQEILQSPVEPSDLRPVKLAKEYYSLCMDEAATEAKGVAPLLKILEPYGGWPSITPNWDPAKFDVNKAIADGYRNFGNALILNIIIGSNVTNNSQYLLWFGKPTRFFLPESVLLNQEKFSQQINAYKAYYVNVAKELAKKTGMLVTEAGLTAEVEDVIQFETRLVRSNESNSLNNTTFTRRNVNVTYANKDLPPSEILDLEIVFNHIFSTSGLSFNETANLDLYYILNVTAILRSTRIRTVANYFMWRLVSVFSTLTTKTMLDLKFDFDKNNTGLIQPGARETTCVSAAMAMFAMPLGAKYVEKTFDFNSKKEVEEMAENLSTSFRHLLTEASWMDEETKTAAMQKLKAMKKLVAFPSWFFNSSRLERTYDGFDIVPGDYFQSTLAYLRWVPDLNLTLLRRIPDAYQWASSPLTVNAFNMRNYNSITIPAGIIQPPFFQRKGLKSLNYAEIGTSIGHEIAHGFDIQGTKFDFKGNLKNWWMVNTLYDLLVKAHCFVDQYSNVSTYSGPLNGILTVNEDIADNAGVRGAFMAYQNWVKYTNGGRVEPRLLGLENYTPEQLFFLGFANKWCETTNVQREEYLLYEDSHTPARYRVQLPLQNFQEFAHHWNCPIGSPMNPRQGRCIIW